MTWIFPLHGPRNPRTCALATLLATAISLPLGAIAGGGILWLLFQDMEQATSVAYWTGPIAAVLTFFRLGARIRDQGILTPWAYLRGTGGTAFGIGMLLLWTCGSYKLVYLATPLLEVKAAELNPDYVPNHEARRAAAIGLTTVLWILFVIGSAYVAWFRGGQPNSVIRGEAVATSRLTMIQRIRAGLRRKPRKKRSKEQVRVDFLLDRSNLLGGVDKLTQGERDELQRLSKVIKAQRRSA